MRWFAVFRNTIAPNNSLRNLLNSKVCILHLFRKPESFTIKPVDINQLNQNNIKIQKIHKIHKTDTQAITRSYLHLQFYGGSFLNRIVVMRFVLFCTIRSMDITNSPNCLRVELSFLIGLPLKTINSFCWKKE